MEESTGLVFAALDFAFPDAAMPTSTGALYIAIIRQFFQASGSPEAALVVLSMVTSGLASAALYLLGVAFLSEMAGSWPPHCSWAARSSGSMERLACPIPATP